MARFLLEMKEEENEPVQPPVRVSAKPRSLSPSSPLSSSPSPPSSPIQFAASPRVIKPTPALPVSSNTERKSVLQTARVFQKPKSDPFWNYSEKPKPKPKFSFKKPVNGKFIQKFRNFRPTARQKISEATEMLNLTIGSYTAMKCSYYQNVDGELCCKTVKVDGKFKSGVKIKARFHFKSSLTAMFQKGSI